MWYRTRTIGLLPCLGVIFMFFTDPLIFFISVLATARFLVSSFPFYELTASGFWLGVIKFIGSPYHTVQNKKPITLTHSFTHQFMCNILPLCVSLLHTHHIIPLKCSQQNSTKNFMCLCTTFGLHLGLTLSQKFNFDTYRSHIFLLGATSCALLLTYVPRVRPF